MCIGILKNKWRQFEPTTDYLSAIKELNTITKLHKYILDYKYVSDKKDYWQTPIETYIRGKGDCEDFARFTIDVLIRIQNRKNVRFICYCGYSLSGGKMIKSGHAVTVFPYNEKYSVFSNNYLLHQYNDYIEIGHEFYPKGLKYMEIRDGTGKILQRKFKVFGTF
ncbi:hypothetical protein KAX02_00710 [candidate division WOR-3 bacterium]|nr:hypothetical protein [candidate division WOR-3 bacterium]